MNFWPYSITAVFCLIALGWMSLHFFFKSMIEGRRNVAAILSLITLGAAGVYLPSRETQLRRRNDLYQQTLAAYQAGFPIGLTRQAVNDRLRLRNIVFNPTQTSSSNGFWEDRIPIGEEGAYFPCSETIVQVAFVYANPASQEPSRINPSDELQEIRLHFQPSGCL